MSGVWHWILTVTGTNNEAGRWYAWWSGSGADLSYLTGSAAIVAHAARSRNCEVHGCWRLGRHKTAANHSVCRSHHPDDSLSAEDVLVAHAAAKQ
jgi:hypothetical protein